MLVSWEQVVVVREMVTLSGGSIEPILGKSGGAPFPVVSFFLSLLELSSKRHCCIEGIIDDLWGLRRILLTVPYPVFEVTNL